MRVPQYIAKIRAMADGAGLTRDKFKILVGSWSLACASIRCVSLFLTMERRKD